MPEHPYLSIGEVLALLLEEFPDVTISKIRFLESQGLIDPERTPSGYRKFYDLDVDRLRVILREQKENFLPLRVIRDRLENGQIDDSGSLTPPRGIRNVTVLERHPGSTDGGFDETGDLDLPEGTVVPTGHHPAAQLRLAPSVSPPPIEAPTVVALVSAPSAAIDAPPPTAWRRPASHANPLRRSSPPTHPPPVETAHDTYGRELCAMPGITSKQLAELESFGLLAGVARAPTLYSADDLAIARAAAGFLGPRCRAAAPARLAPGGRTRSCVVRAAGAATHPPAQPAEQAASIGAAHRTVTSRRRAARRHLELRVAASPRGLIAAKRGTITL
ncbi:MAG: MerR family transcriptional regulator [Acidimicrobiaceae bacterium]|nr:MerR family transcriptional regulator [Acidimicrobiaceae bacterium]